MDAPLAGVRVLALEQAVALPSATRFLADLGADVIRVQSHRRARGGGGGWNIDLTRSKRQVGLDLDTEAGPGLFLRLAANCDIVCHNFTPRVVRRFGIDFEHVRAVNPTVIYLSLTGFGTTGPWAQRPLFGPGAEAVAGHNLLIGSPEEWPGRPGTGAYADNLCGLYAVLGVLAALDRRDRFGAEAQHLDVSLYETCVAHLGPVLAERSLGAEPQRNANEDKNYAIHDVFATDAPDRHVAVSARAEQLAALAAALGLDGEATRPSVAGALARMRAEEAVTRLQAHGVAAAVVADARDLAEDPALWARGYYGFVPRTGEFAGEAFPHAGPPWGGGAAAAMYEPAPVGADNAAVLRDVGGLDEAAITELAADGVIGTVPDGGPVYFRADEQIRIERGELARIDVQHDGWRAMRAAAGAQGGVR